MVQTTGLQVRGMPYDDRGRGNKDSREPSVRVRSRNSGKNGITTVLLEGIWLSPAVTEATKRELERSPGAKESSNRINEYPVIPDTGHWASPTIESSAGKEKESDGNSGHRITTIPSSLSSPRQKGTQGSPATSGIAISHEVANFVRSSKGAIPSTEWKHRPEWKSSKPLLVKFFLLKAGARKRQGQETKKILSNSNYSQGLAGSTNDDAMKTRALSSGLCPSQKVCGIVAAHGQELSRHWRPWVSASVGQLLENLAEVISQAPLENSSVVAVMTISYSE
ncbi:hypothetical protein F5887DRAFT_1206378 [Amanita rubescens]|nr:hypothetical protein F5887DRAFT_1206378 [Amanita rubescens]